MGVRAAPLIETEPAEAILERVPKAASPRSVHDLSALSSHIRSEVSV
jgi:hypothetical protein